MSQEKLYALMDFFRNYNFQLLHSNRNTKSQMNDRHQNISLETSLEQCVSKGRSLILLLEQKLHQCIGQNQSLSSQVSHLKAIMAEQKKQADKLLDCSRQIIEELRRELIEKDEENKALIQKIEDIQTSQADQLSFVKRLELQGTYELQNRLKEDRTRYEGKMKQLLRDIQRCKQEKIEYEEKNNKLQEQIQRLMHEIWELKASKQQLQSQIKTLSFHEQPQSHTKYIHKKEEHRESLASEQLQIYDNIQLPILHTSQDEILNSSYEQGTALKDVLLNYEDYHNSRFVGEYLRSKEKENLQDNYPIKINNTESDKKLNCSKSKRKIFNASRQTTEFVIKTTVHENSSVKNHINEFTLHNSHTYASSSSIDPYWAYFMLTSQMIKINSPYFQQIAQIDITERQWNYVIENRVPMNLWQQHLEHKMLTQAKIQLV